MAVRKKGALFTIISIILVASLIFSYISMNRYSEKDEIRVIQTRIVTINAFISDIEQDIVRGLFISSMRSLIGLSEHIAEEGEYLGDLDKDFNEIMLNGTIMNVSINLTEDANFGTWMGKIIDIGEKLAVDVRFSGLGVKIYQEDPWNVKVAVLGKMNLSDMKGTASWSRDINLSTKLEIEDYEDPLYTIGTEGKLTNRIVRSNITDFVVGSDASNLKLHANNSWYIASNLSPSFIMRLTGNFSASPNGIESIVNIPELQVAWPPAYYPGRSTVDYIYFDNTTVSNCMVNETKIEMPWFRLDDDHLDIYETVCAS